MLENGKQKTATSQPFEDRDVYFYITIYKLPGIYQNAQSNKFSVGDRLGYHCDSKKKNLNIHRTVFFFCVGIFLSRFNPSLLQTRNEIGAVVMTTALLLASWVVFNDVILGNQSNILSNTIL